MLADLLVASKDDALLYEQLLEAAPDLPAGRYEVARYQGFTSVEFGSLWVILEDCAWDVNRHMLQSLLPDAERESWLEEFPAEFVQCIASSDTSALLRAATAWGQTEELQCPATELHPVLLDLQRLAQLALSEREGLYLWGSL